MQLKGNLIKDKYKNIMENYEIPKTSKNTILVNILFTFQNNTLKFQEKHFTMVMI